MRRRKVCGRRWWFQVEDQPKHGYRVGVGETLCWVVHINQGEVGFYSHWELVWKAVGSL